jgi:hypothetical protein
MTAKIVASLYIVFGSVGISWMLSVWGRRKAIFHPLPRWVAESNWLLLAATYLCMITTGGAIWAELAAVPYLAWMVPAIVLLQFAVNFSYGSRLQCVPCSLAAIAALSGVAFAITKVY